MFNDSIKINFTLSFDSWTTDSKILCSRNEFQVDIEKAANILSSEHSKITHQTEAIAGATNREKQNCSFDTFDVLKQICEIDGIRCPKDPV